jgi:hypothetical protein
LSGIALAGHGPAAVTAQQQQQQQQQQQAHQSGLGPQDLGLSMRQHRNMPVYPPAEQSRFQTSAGPQPVGQVGNLAHPGGQSAAGPGPQRRKSKQQRAADRKRAPWQSPAANRRQQQHQHQQQQTGRRSEQVRGPSSGTAAAAGSIGSSRSPAAGRPAPQKL